MMAIVWFRHGKGLEMQHTKHHIHVYSIFLSKFIGTMLIQSLPVQQEISCTYKVHPLFCS